MGADVDVTKAFFDAYVPTGLVQAFCAAQRRRIGAYHDAAEALEYLLECTGMHGNVFDARSTNNCNGVLQRGVPDGMQGHLHDQGDMRHVDMRKALTEAFANNEDKLNKASKLLAVHCAGRTYGDALMNIYDDFLVTWPHGGSMDININGQLETYRLKAIVEMTGEHFIAHWRSNSGSDAWYTADDSQVWVREDIPNKLPYICFLEHAETATQDDWLPRSTAAQPEVSSDSEQSECEPEDPEGLSQGGNKRIMKRPSSAPSHAAAILKRPSGKCGGVLPTVSKRPAKASTRMEMRQAGLKRDRPLRKQDRSVRKQDRSGRKEPDRSDRKQARSDRKPQNDARESAAKKAERSMNDLRGKKTRPMSDNNDGSRCDHLSNQANPLERSRREAEILLHAKSDRWQYGDLFFLLCLLEDRLGIKVLAAFPHFLTYAGDDCSPKWASYLQDPDRPNCMRQRLQDALGVSDDEVRSGKERIEKGEWTLTDVAELLDEILEAPTVASLRTLVARHTKDHAPRENALREYLNSAFSSRTHKEGPPHMAAMRARLRDRSRWRSGAHPTLDFTCGLCEAEFPNRRRFEEHVEKVHGGHRWYSAAFTARVELEPYIPSPTESRSVIRRFSMAQQYETTDPENEPYSQGRCVEKQKAQLWAELFLRVDERLASDDVADLALRKQSEREVAAVTRLQADSCYAAKDAATAPERRSFKACVICAMQFWSEALHSEYIAGAGCNIANNEAFADLLDVERYKARWPDIPEEELNSSAVEFTCKAEDGEDVQKQLLLHKRRVSTAAQKGEEPVSVCADCRKSLWKSKPTMPKKALANDLWLGRLPPLFMHAPLSHQLLLPLGRVVTTKVYLSSKGGDQAVRQERESWRKKFLQSGMKGTAIVFGNGRADKAMESFPPEPDVVKDTFVAVFTGPEEEQGVMLTEEQQHAKALKALRNEVSLQVHKQEFDEQARHLLQHNYVYKKRAHYRADLVNDFPDDPAVPACLEACAKFVPTTCAHEDTTRAQGPASSTTGAQMEQEALSRDGVTLTEWLSIVDDQLDEVSEITSIPALQGLLERMESQAGRVVANELSTVIDGESNTRMDEVGRYRLKRLCEEFHMWCRKWSPAEELSCLLDRVAALEHGGPSAAGESNATDGLSEGLDSAKDEGQSKQATLRVPTSRKAETWWSPEYWSIARPTDFVYGDCAWGLAKDDASLAPTVEDMIQILFLREEMEYDCPSDVKKYVASATNRFRDSWYDLHLLHSFWRVTETTRSVHTFMKSPGAYGMARSCATLTPAMLEGVVLKAQQTTGKTTLQSVLSDADTPQQVKAALRSLHQATASLIGADGHRRELRGEGEAYTLRYGPPLVFITPNLADNKQYLILCVQGEPLWYLMEDKSYKEMTQRVARDPVGQALVFELMIRLFFVHVLGLRPETVGWRRGAMQKAASQWTSGGIAADLQGVPMLFGPVVAAFGPVEAQGRGSLHPHILVWLLQASIYEVLRLLQRDRSRFKERLDLWMREVVQAVVACQHTAVTEFPSYLQGGADEIDVQVPPLPFGTTERKTSCMDGAREIATAEQMSDTTPGSTQGHLYYYEPSGRDGEGVSHPAVRADLPLRLTSGEVVDSEAWQEARAAETTSIWSKSINTWAAGSFPEYRLGITRGSIEVPSEASVDEKTDCPNSALASPLERRMIPSEEWIRKVCFDARELVIGCAVHVCSPSCWKYHSKGANYICRHGFYHVVTLYGEDDSEVRFRRRGKPLRGCVGIFRETRYGMAGRVITYQVHPYECPTNYATIVASRCNVDVQDLRRVLPPEMWMSANEHEPAAIEEDGDSYNHGAYPQRYKQYSLGMRETWGWFKHMGTTAMREHEACIFTDWHKIFADLSETSCGTATSLPNDIQDAATAYALASYSDAHNAGFYINSYTTKVNPTLDDVLRNLLDGVRRLQSEWQDSESKLVSESDSNDGGVSKRREDFRKTMQVLSRFESCFRRSSWKSGSEMVFPMLFGHLAFMTHRCWNLFMRKAIYLGAEAWRRKYGQLATHCEKPPSIVTFTLPGGQSVAMDGWTHDRRDGADVYIGPEGDEYDTIGYAYEAFQAGKAGGNSLSAVTRALQNFKEGGAAEPTVPGISDLAAKNQGLRSVTLSQHDDWMHRGTHPIVRSMSLYVYSIWVYRAELPHFRAKDQVPDDSTGRSINIAFDSSYSAAKNWVQRIAAEPRVPKVSGFQFVAESSNAETHFLMKSILLRPLDLPIADDEVDTKELRYLAAYKELCSAPEGDHWPAQRTSDDSPGPFERGWKRFLSEQQAIFRTAQRKCLKNDLHAWAFPSLWLTKEVEEELQRKRADDTQEPTCRNWYDEQMLAGSEIGNIHCDNLLTVEEYVALETIKTAANFDGLGNARTTKPRRKVDADVNVVEKLAFVESSGHNDSSGLGQVEGAELRAKHGMATFGANTSLAHRFDPQTLQNILAFDTAERTSGFVKDLKQTALMTAGELPRNSSDSDAQERRRSMQEKLIGPLRGLKDIDCETLGQLVDTQRKGFAQGQREDEDEHMSENEAKQAAAPKDCPTAPPFAVFIPSSEFKRPSDYVKHLVRRFEAGKENPKTGQVEPKPLKRDQALFVARFAEACNDVWDDEQKILDGNLQHKNRRCYQFLLMGQGGSGKTAIIQEIVLPALDGLFPAEPGGTKATLIVCAKWSQAENISTAEHKAVTCHRAGCIGVQSYRNRDMQAKGRKAALKRTWEALRCLVVEEVSMISPYMYNMLHYRSFLGRSDRYEVHEQEYDQLRGAFGRMPISIHLGDFLQLKPTGCNLSLLADFDDLASKGIELSPEFQAVMKLFCRTPLCFELQASNRFKEPKLAELMAFMREPSKRLPASIARAWEAIRMQPDDPRLREGRFQDGHMIASYWETVARWMRMRATRDAAALNTPLFLIQSADTSTPPMPMADAAKLMNKASPRDTGGMHGLIAVHVGMRIRFLEALDLSNGLVKDSEGDVVEIVVNPLDAEKVTKAFEERSETPVYLEYLPLGFWVKMEKYVNAPFGSILGGHDSSLTRRLTKSLVFVEARTSEPFTFRNFKVIRTGFPISHGRVITTTACQGRTMREGVILDCGRCESGQGKKDDDDWYPM